MDDMELRLLIDLHRSNFRQGPGGDVETHRAIQLAGLRESGHLKIADIGCGTGASTFQLARELDAEITAVDFLPEFLEELQIRAVDHGVSGRISPIVCSMDALPFSNEEFDVIWSEGAIYNMGFEAGVSAWRRFLKPGGKLVASEITWLTEERPAELQSYWETEYPEIGPASEKIAVLERLGFRPVGYFVLPETCWVDNYYQPLQNGFDAFLNRHRENRQAGLIIERELAEIALYNKFRQYFSYGFYVAVKV